MPCNMNNSGCIIKTISTNEGGEYIVYHKSEDNILKYINNDIFRNIFVVYLLHPSISGNGY